MKNSKEEQLAKAYQKWAKIEYAKHKGGKLVVVNYDENDNAVINILPTFYPKPTWDGFTKTKEFKKITAAFPVTINNDFFDTNAPELDFDDEDDWDSAIDDNDLL